MRRNEGAPAKKCRGTGQGSDSDDLSFCVVGTADQRAGFDLGEAEGEALDSKVDKSKNERHLPKVPQIAEGHEAGQRNQLRLHTIP
jgi:hypothetical protein